MGNKNSTPTKIIPAASANPVGLRENLLVATFRNKFPIWLSNEIWFEILAFVKLHESPNIFLVNCYLLPICQEFFHSGNVGSNKSRNVRDLKMQLREGEFTILVERNGQFVPAPVPEIESPSMFKSFGKIRVENSCRIQAMQFLIKFQALLSNASNKISFKQTFLQPIPNVAMNTDGNAGRFKLLRWINNTKKSKKQQNGRNIIPVVDQYQFFFDWLMKRRFLICLEASYFSRNICRVLAEPLIAQFIQYFMMEFKNEGNLSEEDSKLIYEWISSSNAQTNKWLVIHHFDPKKALQLASQVAKLFEKDHCDKVKAEKMLLTILLPKGKQVPNLLQKICNIHGDHLATLCTITMIKNGEQLTTAYLFSTNVQMKCLKLNEIKKEETSAAENNDKTWDLVETKRIYFD